jgi:hypothetical protein
MEALYYGSIILLFFWLFPRHVMYVIRKRILRPAVLGYERDLPQ